MKQFVIHCAVAIGCALAALCCLSFTRTANASAEHAEPVSRDDSPVLELLPDGSFGLVWLAYPPDPTQSGNYRPRSKIWTNAVRVNDFRWLYDFDHHFDRSPPSAVFIGPFTGNHLVANELASQLREASVIVELRVVDVELRVRDGHVTITGELLSEADRQTVLEILWQHSKVKSIEDSLTVRD